MKAAFVCLNSYKLKKIVCDPKKKQKNMKDSLLCWFCVFIYITFTQAKDNNHQDQVVCFGETLKLKCDGGNIEIHGAYYKVLQQNSTLCGGINVMTSPCHQPSLELLIRNDCHGKKDCVLSYRNNDGRIDCRSSMYLNVVYACVYKSTHQPGDVPILPTPEAEVTKVVSKKKNENDSGGSAFFRALVELKIIIRYCKEHQGKVLLSTLLGVAFGIFVFILFTICSLCCLRNRRKTGKLDIEDGKVINVSAPVVSTPAITKYETVLITRQNGVPTSEMTISSDATLTLNSKGKKQHDVISTIRRTHSVDEGTQTDIENVSQKHFPRTLSVAEKEELGSLVNAMDCYTTWLDDDDTYPQVELRETYKNNQNNSGTFYYSTPTQQTAQSESSSGAYSNPYDSASEGRRVKMATSSRNHSYTTSISTNSLNCHAANTNDIRTSDSMRDYSVQRVVARSAPLSPKLGVRGDGFDFIQ